MFPASEHMEGHTLTQIPRLGIAFERTPSKRQTCTRTEARDRLDPSRGRRPDHFSARARGVQRRRKVSRLRQEYGVPMELRNGAARNPRQRSSVLLGNFRQRINRAAKFVDVERFG